MRLSPGQSPSESRRKNGIVMNGLHLNALRSRSSANDAGTARMLDLGNRSEEGKFLDIKM